MWEVTKEFSFEAAHSLDHLPKTHKCHHLHGHSYKVIVRCSGDIDPVKQWLVDYADISSVTEPVIALLDHRNINEVINRVSTAENLAYWLFSKLHPKLPSLSAVEVRETEKTSVVYKPYQL